MILTAEQIANAVETQLIVIDPFDSQNLNPNSYNYHLGQTLKIASPPFDAKADGTWTEVPIPNDGYLLEPHKIYLANTAERIGSEEYVTTLLGRSSMGRLGLFLQVSADLGHVGPAHRWTLELNVVQPIRVYPGIPVGQVCFWRCRGRKIPYRGPYSRYDEPVGPITGVIWR